MVFEIVFGQSLSLAGAHILPNSAAMTLSAPLMGYLVKRTKRYKKLTVLCCIGPVVAMALLSTLNLQSSWAVQWLSKSHGEVWADGRCPPDGSWVQWSSDSDAE